MTATPSGGQAPPPRLRLGPRRYDLERQALVLGLLDPSETADERLARAERAVLAGADILGVGRHQAWAADEEMSEAEEIDRLAPTVEALGGRFDLPIAVATASPKVLETALAAGAVLADDPSGAFGPAYLDTVERAGGSMVVRPVGAVEDVPATLAAGAARARAAGLADDRVVVDTGLAGAASPAEHIALLRQAGRLTGLACPLLVSVLDQPFVAEPRQHALVAAAYGLAHGGRIVAGYDVPGIVRVVRAMEHIFQGAAR